MRQQQGSEVSKRKPARRLTMVVAAVVATCAAFAATAQASVISIGSVLPQKFEGAKFERVQTLFNTALPEAGATLSSPVNGAIVRWRVQGAKGGPFYLRVLHPNGKGGYEAAGTSQGASPSGEGLQTFSTNLKIQAGDLVGIDPTGVADEIGVAEASGASYASIFPTPFDGSVVPPSESFSGKEIELSAEIQPQPEITLVSPPFGPVTGGTVTTITGKNFTNASEVKFGSTAATFTVDSDTEITATAPKTERPGQVDVSVTTFAGANPNTRFDDYTYLACVVPRIKNRTLKVAKTLLRRRGCKLGHVKKVDAPTPKKVGKVLKQQPAPGKILAPGSRVRIQLGT
ncbi:MAG TPA: IPT/TIG domain-containing protein [Solirubrobacterales bacterium]|nr:IPT/TIG domain-containing protein [Solirubrobacterales bacterium]